MSHADARIRMKAAKEADDPVLLRRTFAEICANFQPAFRFFFLEYFASGGEAGGAAAWWRRRLAYAESLAVSSMVGHVMGIGDRHTQNILIDTRTAEVVQIDFGIVFEQGKTLSTPETVPFRLTRDLVRSRLHGVADEVWRSFPPPATPIHEFPPPRFFCRLNRRVHRSTGSE
jgi:ataxia telangiectasia mutated family protein